MSLKEIKLSRPRLEQLFNAIGGEAGLERILDRFYEKMRDDLMLGFFFQGRDLRRIARMQGAFLLKAWGISKDYPGRPPQNAHTELPPILTGHFDRRLVVLSETLHEFGLEQPLIDTWVEFERRFRGAVQAK